MRDQTTSQSCAVRPSTATPGCVRRVSAEIPDHPRRNVGRGRRPKVVRQTRGVVGSGMARQRCGVGQPAPVQKVVEEGCLPPIPPHREACCAARGGGRKKVARRREQRTMPTRRQRAWGCARRCGGALQCVHAGGKEGSFAQVVRAVGRGAPHQREMRRGRLGWRRQTVERCVVVCSLSMRPGSHAAVVW